MILKPYQLVGADFLSRRPRALLGDDMGLGKTAQAIEGLNREGIRDALIICPASLKLNWKDELATWLKTGASVGIAEGKKWPYTDITIINYDILGKHKAMLNARKWPVVIVDEAHYIQSRTSDRTKYVMRIPGIRRWLLTGTPALNRPENLWPLLRYLQPDEWKSFREFAMRYCDPKWVLEQRGRVKVKKFSTAGASNVEELAARLAPLMLRRLKSDVLTELPEKIRQTILIPIGSRDVREAIQMEREEQHRHDPHGVVKGDLAKARKILGLAKVAPALEHITTLLQSEAKVVVFAHHHDVIDKLADSLGAWLQIRVVTGNTSLAQRHEAVTAFQNDPGVRVFIGNIQAAGVGLTLTAAAVTVFVEQDWGPKIMEQAEDRINRLGQTRGTLIQYICFEGSLDAIMARTCARKEEVIQSIIKPTEGVIEMSIESILERIATALEKQTEQYDALLRKEYIAKPASTAGAAPAAPAPAAPASTAPATGWDPRAEKPLARYGADKRAILESVATEMGLTFDEKTPGTQLHGMILGAGTAAPAPAAGSNEPDLPVDEGFGDFNLDTPPAVEEARKYTAEETRAALIGYCKAQGAKDAAPAGALIKQVLGKDKFTDVDPADYYKLVDAANAASM